MGTKDVLFGYFELSRAFKRTMPIRARALASVGGALLERFTEPLLSVQTGTVANSTDKTVVTVLYEPYGN